MDFPLHHRAQRIVYHAMPRLDGNAGEAPRHDDERVVSAAAAGAFVASVLRGVVPDLEELGLELRELLAHPGAGVGHSVPLSRTCGASMTACSTTKTSI